MNQFLEIIFPQDISYGSSGGPEFSTEIATSSSGHEARNINWKNSLAKYNISYGIKTQSQIDNIISFFRITHGKAFAFRFKDWLDYKAENQKLLHLEDKKFLFFKDYKISNYVYSRRIFKLTGEIKIYKDGEILQPDQYTLDINQGYISCNNNINITDQTIITSDFEFHIPVRFNNDFLSISAEQTNISSCRDIFLIETRLQ